MNGVWCRCRERKQRLPCANLWRPVPGPSMCWSTGCSVHTRRRRTGPARPRTSSSRRTWGCRCSGWPAGPPPCTGGRRLAHTRGRATGRTPLWTTSGASRQDGRKGGGGKPGENCRGAGDFQPTTDGESRVDMRAAAPLTSKLRVFTAESGAVDRRLTLSAVPRKLRLYV